MADSIRFHDPRLLPFSIHGLYHPTDVLAHGYRRLPDDVAAATNPDVMWLHLHTAGGRIRFATNADTMVLRVTLAPHGTMPHCTPMLESGFDLYLDTPHASRFVGEFKFDTSNSTAYEASLPLPSGEKELTLNMPLYGSVIEVKIGLPADAAVRLHAPYRQSIPVVFYGSSITQGACASRPGLCCQGYITRRFDCDYINLGFSGSARAEEAIVNYMASLPMSAFVSDYDHNAPSPEHLRNTHHAMYRKIRETHPDVPYIMISKPDFLWRDDDLVRRDIIMESYLAARATGDRNVYFLDGASFFIPTLPGESRADFTADNCHPTDVGFRRMAASLGDVLEAAWGQT